MEGAQANWIRKSPSDVSSMASGRLHAIRWNLHLRKDCPMINYSRHYLPKTSGEYNGLFIVLLLLQRLL